MDPLPTPPRRGLVHELQSSHRAMVATLCAMLALSLAASGYLLLVSQPRVQEYTDMTRDARVLREAMLDQETGLRGWLATGDRLFLGPFVSGRRDAELTSDKLVDSVALSRDTARNIYATLLARAEWETWADEAAARAVSDDERTSGRLTASLLEGKALFDRFRSADDTSTDEIVGLRDSALREQRVSLLVALGAQLGLLFVAALLAWRRRARLETSVLRPVRDVLAGIGQLRGGDLTAGFGRTGVVELDEVGQALDALAGDLGAAQEEAVARESRLELLAGRLATVVRVARETSGSLSTRYVAESVAGAAAELLGSPTTLWVRTDDGLFRAMRRSGDPHGAVPPTDLEPPALVAAVAADARAVGDDVGRAYPLVLAGMVVGVLQTAAVAADDDTEQVVEALLSTAAAALESARLHSSAREMAEIDALTHLPNRHRLEVDLAAEWERSGRYGRPMSFVMVDLDHFKRLNDDHGHLVGDEVLRAVADALAAHLRSSDTAYRYGGEELAVLLRETDAAEAMVTAERLRAAVSGVTPAGRQVTVTASLGVAERDAGMLHHSDLVERADGALYEAKRNGRDQVRCAQPLLARS